MLPAGSRRGNRTGDADTRVENGDAFALPDLALLIRGDASCGGDGGAGAARGGEVASP